MVAIRTGNENNKLVVLEIANRKDNVEIVGCRYSGNELLEQLKKQAEREGGQLLILTSNEAAAGLSTLPSAVSNGKGKENVGNVREMLKIFQKKHQLSPKTMRTS